jgi:hypothetical protein
LFLIGWFLKNLLLWNHYGRSSISSWSVNNMATTGNTCFWLVDFKKSSLKPLDQMNRNLVGSIYGRSSIKIAHFILIR